MLVSYSFSDNRTDVIVNDAGGNNGSVVGSGLKWLPAGAIGGSLRFYGNQAINANLPNETFSQLALFVCAYNTVSGGNLINYRTSTNMQSRIYAYPNGTVLYDVPTWDEYYFTPTNYSSGYHCFTLTCDGLKCYAYGDKNLEATLTNVGNFSSDLGLYVGARNTEWGINEYVSSDIDEVRVYSYNLTRSRVESLVDSFITTTTSTTTTSSTTTSSTSTSSSTTSTSTTTTTTTTTTSSTTTTTLPEQVSVSRDLPSSISSGSSFTVTLLMEVNESNAPETLGLTEYFPEGWNVSSVSLAGVLKTSPDRIEWLFSPLGHHVRDQEITYVLTIPEGINGTFEFSGNSDLGATNISTTGDETLIVTAGCSLSGNLPPCDQVMLNEVVVFVNEWIDGNAYLSDVIALINAWASSD